MFTATTPFSFLTTTVSSRGTLDAFSTALSAARRTRRLLVTLFVRFETTFLSLAPLLFLLCWTNGCRGSAPDDWLVVDRVGCVGEVLYIHNTCVCMYLVVNTVGRGPWSLTVYVLT